MSELVRIILIVLAFILKFQSVENENLPAFEILWTPDVIIVGESHEILMKLKSPLSTTVNVTFVEDQADLIDWSPKIISVPPNSHLSNFTIKIDTKKAGKVEVIGTSNPKNLIDDFNLFFKITIGNSRGLIIASVIVGWTYFLAWGVCSYPQIFLNYHRKSVIGLSFDFLALNIVGHVSYTIFNVCLYFGKYFQDEYFLRFPHGQTPVLLNDVFSTTHGVVVYTIIIFQCFVYKRGTQRISYITWSLLGCLFATIIVVVIFCSIGTLHWLDFLYTLSYIKLAIALIKCVPQAVLNYRRKSTIGWSIERVLLDLTGGVLSILQMFINSYNYDDWQSNFGNLAKLCLGMLSIIFDIIFTTQHYCLYRNAQHAEENKPETTEMIAKPEEKE